jgi:site-specific DNA-methyltransferase (adenine-specific)/modification methylase
MIPDSVRKYVYYEEPGIILLHGDCLEILPMLDRTHDLLTDPPYGINYDSKWLTQVHLSKGTAPNKVDEKIINDDKLMDLTILFEWDKRLIWGFPYIHDTKSIGWIVWDKQPQVDWRGLTTPVEIASTTMRKGYDLVHCMWAGFLRDTQLDEIRYEHPTQKPIKVIKGCIERFCKGEIILDPFLGSGTTAVAAKQLGRKCIGIEIESKYLDIAIERLRQEQLF